MRNPVRAVAILALFVAASCAGRHEGGPRGAVPGPTHEAWQRHCDTLRQRGDLVRRYTFETPAPDNPVAASVAGENEPLTYVSKEPLQVVEGRWPGKKAVRLDRGCFEGAGTGTYGVCPVQDQDFILAQGESMELPGTAEVGLGWSETGPTSGAAKICVRVSCMEG